MPISKAERGDKFEWIWLKTERFFTGVDISPVAVRACVSRDGAKGGEAQAQPLSVGRAIIATREPHETLVIELIKQLGLELQVIFNKGAVMVLPTGVNKATGLTCALKEMEIEAQNVVAVGDAENDHAFLALCGIGVAVGNALPMLKERADLVVDGKRGFGVTELIDELWQK